MKKLIENFILDSEDYPSMQDLIDHFRYMDGEEFAEMFMMTLQLRDEGKILYDDKHDIWIYTGISNPKLQKLVDESIRI